MLHCVMLLTVRLLYELFIVTALILLKKNGAVVGIELLLVPKLSMGYRPIRYDHGTSLLNVHVIAVVE